MECTSNGSESNLEGGLVRGGRSPELAEFIAERDSLYLGTAGKDGQPYIQYCGGPKGFLKVLDEHTLAFAEFQGTLNTSHWET